MNGAFIFSPGYNKHLRGFSILQFTKHLGILQSLSLHKSWVSTILEFT